MASRDRIHSEEVVSIETCHGDYNFLACGMKIRKFSCEEDSNDAFSRHKQVKCVTRLLNAKKIQNKICKLFYFVPLE